MLFVREVREGYILINKLTRGHAHFADYEGACMCLDLIRRGKMPRSPYLRESARRVCTKKQWRGLS